MADIQRFVAVDGRLGDIMADRSTCDHDISLAHDCQSCQAIAEHAEMTAILNEVFSTFK